MTTGKGPYDKECSCGGSWEEVEWCELHNEACALGDYCAHNVFSRSGCEFQKDKLRCKKCGVIVDAQ